MIKLNFLLIILTVGFSCAQKQDLVIKKINITTINKANDQPVDSVKVTLTSMNNSEIYTDTKYSDSVGLCKFSFEYKPYYEYSIHAQKDDYWTFLSNDSLNTYRITKDTQRDLTFYLTSDSLQNIEYWKSQYSRYDIDTLISILKNNELTRLPLLTWNDIPKLIGNSTDSTILTIFPRNPLSSYWQKECYLGVISLWFIEIIRKIELTGNYIPFEVYPSLNPIIRQSNGANNKTDIEKMNLASNIYSEWWEKIKHLDKKEACIVDPFRDTNLNW